MYFISWQSLLLQSHYKFLIITRTPWVWNNNYNKSRPMYYYYLKASTSLQKENLHPCPKYTTIQRISPPSGSGSGISMSSASANINNQKNVKQILAHCCNQGSFSIYLYADGYTNKYKETETEYERKYHDMRSNSHTIHWKSSVKF